MDFKNLIKNILPPFIVKAINKYRTDYGWKGNFSSWDEALEASLGYDDPAIFAKIQESATMVRDGVAVYERDGVLFDEIEYSWPLLCSIFMAAAIAKNNSVVVLDFGGGLGSSFYQNRKFLAQLDEIKWLVVEQPELARIGKSEFENNGLYFFDNFADAMRLQKPNILVFASVLQYLKEPYDILSQILMNDIEFVVIDRTIVARKNEDRICIQKVPASIYKASYPCRILSHDKLLHFFEEHGYSLIETYETMGWRTDEFEFNGYVFRKLK